MTWQARQLPELNQAQFSAWQRLFERSTGMYISDQRRSLLQSCLAIRMRELDCHDYDAYFKQVQSKPKGLKEWATLLDRVMVRETRFNRNVESLALVQAYVAKHVAQAPATTLKLWSVGCCTGEEAYSLAMLCHQLYESQQQDPNFVVSGTDISLPCLARARQAEYQKKQLSNLGPSQLKRYFEHLDSDRYQIKPEIKRHVCFSMANIIEAHNNPLRQQDVIYCQNVLVYFTQARRQQVLDALAQRLVPGGLLIVAQGETNNWQHPLLERVDDDLTLAYVRKTSAQDHPTKH